jgi:hypothetical protein
MPRKILGGSAGECAAAGPLWRHPMWRWGLSFIANCTRALSPQFITNLRLALHSLKTLGLRAETGIDTIYAPSVLKITPPRSSPPACAPNSYPARVGLRAADRGECVRREPAPRHLRPVGGSISPGRVGAASSPPAPWPPARRQIHQTSIWA